MLLLTWSVQLILSELCLPALRNVIIPSASAFMPIVPWKRFWLPFGEAIHCGHDGQGFLDDPEGEFTRIHNPNVLSLDQLYGSPCLVLLGEPGMGKTSTLDAERAGLEALYENENCIWIRFRDIPDNITFTRRVFDSLTWKRWSEGSHKLLLVIDGMDEGFVKIPSFVNFLRSELEQVDCSRLNLILVCRVAEWPEAAGGHLLSVFPGDGKSRKFELCPLRQRDAYMAAESYAIDPDEFLKQVYDKSVLGLATRPVTLFMLLKAYAHDGRFPGTFRDLYNVGCRTLCAEVDQERVEQLRQRSPMYVLPSEEQKFAIATRIAALLMLGRKAAVYIGPPKDCLPSDLPLSEIATGAERINGVEFAVNDSWALQTLYSALFNSRGENRLGFAHQTFAESMAASYLAKLPLPQVRSLVCQNDATEQHVIPQLAEVSAWLAGEHREFLDFVLSSEPEVLLRCDIALISADHKRKLVTSLLEGAQREEVFDHSGTDRFYSGLRYPGMAAELVGPIKDKALNIIARRMAIEIAGECQVAELLDPLLDLVRDETDLYDLRKSAASALSSLTPVEKLGELVSLVDGNAPSDPDDHIRGKILEALIPRFCSVSAAIPWLTRTSSDHVGSYWSMLHYYAPRFIEPGDITALFDLVVDRQACFDHTSVFKEIADKTLCEAAKLLADPVVSEGFVTAWLSKTRNHLPLPLDNNFKFNTIYRDAPEVRRRLIAVLLNSSHSTVKDAERFAFSQGPMLSNTELPWLLEELPRVPDAAKPKWVEVIRWQIYPDAVIKCWDLFLDTVEKCPELKAVVGDRTGSWEIDSAPSRKAKADWLRNKRRTVRFQRPQPPPLEPAIQNFVDVGLSGNSLAWVQLSERLFLEEGQTRLEYHKMDVTGSPGWTRANDDRREKFRTIARNFLLEQSDGRTAPNTVTNYTFAGFKAVLLLEPEIRADTALRSAVSKKWLSALCDIHMDDDCFKKAIALAFELDPIFCRSKLEEAYADDSLEHRLSVIMRGLEGVWCPTLSTTLTRLLLQIPRPDSAHNVIQFLAKTDRASALECFDWLIEFLVVNPDENLQKNLLSSAISRLTPETWLRIRALLAEDDQLARAVLLQVAHHNEHPEKPLILEKSAAGLAELYRYLRKLFPITEDPPPHGDIGSSRWSAARLRDQQLTALTSLGTMEACRELLQLAVLFKENSLYLRWRYKECLNTARMKLWTPYSPKAILLLAEKAIHRLIATEADLLEIVLESLDRLEKALVGTNNPQAIDLWNYAGAGNQRREFNPKDEEDISGKIAAWLQMDLGAARGVVLNREVQPRRGTKTDVLVDAVSLDAEAGRLTLVIEVKGCWNAKIKTALQTQLVDEYLIPNGWSFGIYLVGWFICPKWNSTTRPPANHLDAATLEEARAEVAAFAQPYNGIDSPLVTRGYVLDCRLS
jgi:hypothetical protein